MDKNTWCNITVNYWISKLYLFTKDYCLLRITCYWNYISICKEVTITLASDIFNVEYIIGDFKAFFFNAESKNHTHKMAIIYHFINLGPLEKFLTQSSLGKKLLETIWLLVLDRNTWNFKTLWNVYVLDNNVTFCSCQTNDNT